MSDNIRSEKLILTSGTFIFVMMLLDGILARETEKVPRELVGALVLVFMLSSLQFVGLGRVAGPFAVLIAGTVFLTRGGRVYTRLAELSGEESASGSQGGFTGARDIPGGAPGTGG